MKMILMFAMTLAGLSPALANKCPFNPATYNGESVVPNPELGLDYGSSCIMGKGLVSVYCDANDSSVDAHKLCVKGKIRVCRFCKQEDKSPCDYSHLPLAGMPNLGLTADNCRSLENSGKDQLKSTLTYKDLCDVRKNLITQTTYVAWSLRDFYQRDSNLIFNPDHASENYDKIVRLKDMTSGRNGLKENLDKLGRSNSVQKLRKMTEEAENAQNKWAQNYLEISSSQVSAEQYESFTNATQSVSKLYLNLLDKFALLKYQPDDAKEPVECEMTDMVELHLGYENL